MILRPLIPGRQEDDFRLSVTWAFGRPMEVKVATGDLVNDLTRDDCRGTACRTLLPGSGADPGYGKPYPYGPSELASLSNWPSGSRRAHASLAERVSNEDKITLVETLMQDLHSRSPVTF